MRPIALFLQPSMQHEQIVPFARRDGDAKTSFRIGNLHTLFRYNCVRVCDEFLSFITSSSYKS